MKKKNKEPDGVVNVRIDPDVYFELKAYLLLKLKGKKTVRDFVTEAVEEALKKVLKKK